MPNYTIRRPDIEPDAVAELYRIGKTVHDIAEHYACSTRTVLGRLKKAGQITAPVGKTKRYPLKTKAERYEHVRRWRERNPERVKATERARYEIRKAIKEGRLVRPDICENCGIPAKEKPQAAHHNYYLPLDVRWLCRNCHMIWDSDHPKTTQFSKPLGRV